MKARSLPVLRVAPLLLVAMLGLLICTLIACGVTEDDGVQGGQNLGGSSGYGNGYDNGYGYGGGWDGYYGGGWNYGGSSGYGGY